MFHFSDWMYPPQRGGIRSTMVHDLVPLRFPEWVHPRTRRMHAAKYRHAARACDLVFTNSRFTADDVVELLDVPPDRVRVAYPGVDRQFTLDGPRTELEGPYILSVATLEPRKNLQTLVDAFRLLGDGFELAVAGSAGWRAQPQLAVPGVRPLEGFGMPVVEAMACGTPCVVSSHASLDEACGDAAIRVDPERPDAIAAGIARALAERDELSRRGREQAARFTWRENGRVHLDAFAAALA